MILGDILALRVKGRVVAIAVLETVTHFVTVTDVVTDRVIDPVTL